MDSNYKQNKSNPSKQLLSEEQKRVKIKKWDLEVWTSFAPKVKAHEKNSDAYWCYCPDCEKGRKEGTHNLTGLIYEHKNGDGMGFSALPAEQSIPGSLSF